MKIRSTTKHQYYVAHDHENAYTRHNSFQEAQRSMTMQRRRQPDLAPLGIVEVFGETKRWVFRESASEKSIDG